MLMTDKKLTAVVSEKMKGLPEDTIKEVLDFIDFLRSKKEQGKRGTSEVVLKHLGACKFEEGELDNILEDIQKLRELED